MILETETDFDTLAALDADRNAPALDLPTRAEVEGTAPDAPRFAVVDEKSASWVLRKMATNAAEIARVKAQAAQRISELEADARALDARFGSELEAFARSESERRRRKTITLLDGSLCLRTVPAKFVIADGEAAFVNARTACPAAIVEQTTVTLDKAAYLAYAEATGDLTGLEHLPARESFGIKFPSAGKESGTGG